MTIADDPYAASIPWRVTGLLEGLSSADVHVARRLGSIGGEDDERVLLAAALAVQALRGGSVCVVLDDVADAPADCLDLMLRRVSKWQNERNAEPDRPFKVSLSVGGVSWTPDEPRSLEQLIAEADMAAYTAKRRKR